MEDWEAWNVQFQWIEQQWPFILATMIATAIALFSPWTGGLLRWLLGGRQSHRLEPKTAGEMNDRPIRLTAKHSKTPTKYPLKGKQVIATGIITKLDYLETERPSMELYGFPFSVHTDFVCEFPMDCATDLHARRTIELASVVGTAEENIQVGDRANHFKLRLKDCQLRRPPFLNLFRYVWRDTPIAVVVDWLRFGI